MTETGRGAWPRNGRGGTLKTSKGVTSPGQYYLRHPDANQTIGLRAYLLRTAGMPVEQDLLATHYGVIGIQALCSAYLERPVILDGLFETKTHLAVVDVQRKALLKQDGVVGQTTMKILLTPVVKGASGAADVPWGVTYALMFNESAFDPGAIGVLDPNDWGLGQINSLANPHVSFADAMCPSFATKYVANRLKIAMNTLGNLEDAIASYNLGITGARQWVAAGRPDVWKPQYSETERNVRAYINRITTLASSVMVTMR